MSNEMRAIAYDAGPEPCVNGGLIDLDDQALCDRTRYRVRIELRDREKGRWAIVISGGGCFSKSLLDFKDEMLPSSREENFLEDTRFDSAEEAFAFWLKHREIFQFSRGAICRCVLDENSNIKQAPLSQGDKAKIEAAKTWYFEYYNKKKKGGGGLSEAAKEYV